MGKADLASFIRWTVIQERYGYSTKRAMMDDLPIAVSGKIINLLGSSVR
jgi:hypothetical protein